MQNCVASVTNKLEKKSSTSQLDLEKLKVQVQIDRALVCLNLKL